MLFINLGGPQRYVGLAEGQRAPATVVAAVDFDCVNMAATELLRRQAGERVVPVFTIQMAPLNAAWRVHGKLADRALSLRRNPAAPAPGISEAAARESVEKALEADLAVAADLLGISVPGEALATLFSPGKEMDVLAALKESRRRASPAADVDDDLDDDPFDDDEASEAGEVGPRPRGDARHDATPGDAERTDDDGAPTMPMAEDRRAHGADADAGPEAHDDGGDLGNAEDVGGIIDAVDALDLVNGAEIELISVKGDVKRFKLGWMSPARTVFIFSCYPKDHWTVRRPMLSQLLEQGRIRVVSRPAKTNQVIESLKAR